MSWLNKKATSDLIRIRNNIERLEELRSKVHDLGYFVVSSQSGGYKVLKAILDDQLVLGRPHVHKKLLEADEGENHQKVALDAPTRFQRIMIEAEELVGREIRKERIKLKEIVDE